MTQHLHHLCGCAPAPLAVYLKAIGILRLIAEQADPDARGWWQDEHFCLLTKLDRSEIESFFLDSYSPTPFLSPWNKGSGFYKDNDPGLAPLEASSADRFAVFRAASCNARELLAAIALADAAIRAIKGRTKTTKAFQSDTQREALRASLAYRHTLSSLRVELGNPDQSTDNISATQAVISEVESIVADSTKPPTKAEASCLKSLDGYKRLLTEAEKEFKRLKASLLPDCRRAWRGLHAQWMAAGVVLDENGEPQFPSLLGTGGNDGNLDFTNNAMLRLGELFDVASPEGSPRPGTSELLRETLWAEPTNRLSNNAIGQFLPGSGGGANSSTGTGGAPSINPWDFILMMEGAIPFSARATRRLDRLAASKVSAPFAVYSHAAGHASPGDEKDARGEQWMPLWKQPATLGDLQALLGDARLQLGRRSVNRPVDAARAIARLGAARGVAEFTRYGFLERNGQSTLAVPLGRVQVRHRPQATLIDDIAPWMNRLQRLARESHAPARLVHAERRLADAVFAVLTHDETSARWQAVLEAAVSIEAIQAGNTAIKAGPIPTLSPGWVKAAGSGDDSAALRLALALGSAARGFPKGRRPIDPVRHHWLPLEPGAFRFAVSDKRLTHDPRVVISGRDPQADCAAIVRRRLIEAEQDGARSLPLNAAFGCDARLSDLATLIDGEVDLGRVLTLARAFMAIDW
jgi:CRISPR-associated protein Csx17